MTPAAGLVAMLREEVTPGVSEDKRQEHVIAWNKLPMLDTCPTLSGAEGVAPPTPQR